MKFFKLKNPKKFIKVFVALFLTNVFFYLVFMDSEDEKTTHPNLVELVLQAKSFTPINSSKEIFIYDPGAGKIIGSANIINDETPGEEIKKVQLSLSADVAKGVLAKVENTTFHLYPKINGLKIYSNHRNPKKDQSYEIIF